MVERKLQLQVRVLISRGRSRDLKHRETALQKAIVRAGSDIPANGWGGQSPRRAAVHQGLKAAMVQGWTYVRDRKW